MEQDYEIRSTLNAIIYVVVIVGALAYNFDFPRPWFAPDPRPQFVRFAEFQTAATYNWSIADGTGCDTASLDERWYMLCRASSSRTSGGALYEVRPAASGFYLIAVTGKARQHAGANPDLRAVIPHQRTYSFAQVSSVLALFAQLEA